MKKNDLRTAIGGIRAREELVCDTMDKIARYRTEQCTSRGGSQRSFGLGLRIACAACAFALVVGVGLFVGLGGNAPDTISDTDDMRNLDNNQSTDVSDNVTDTQELIELGEIAKGLSGNWMIVCATVDSCVMTENGTAAVSLTVNDFLAYSEGFEFATESITVDFIAEDQAELDGIIDSMSSQRYFLISCNEAGNEFNFTVEKFI